MKKNFLFGEVKTTRPLITEEEYWKTINGLANNSLLDGYSLETLRAYYNTHDENVLSNEAEKEILTWFGVI